MLDNKSFLILVQSIDLTFSKIFGFSVRKNHSYIEYNFFFRTDFLTQFKVTMTEHGYTLGQVGPMICPAYFIVLYFGVPVLDPVSVLDSRVPFKLSNSKYV